MAETKIDTKNDFMVGVSGNGEYITFPIVSVPRQMTKPQALRLAAWIVAIADEKYEFPAILEAVCNT